MTWMSKVVVKPVKTIGRILLSPKDSVEYHDIWRLTFRIPCTDCRHVFIGQTERDLKYHTAKHKYTINQKIKTKLYRALALTSRNYVTFTSVWQKSMAQLQLSDYYYKLDAKLKTRYLEKISLIKQEDPYALKKKNEFCRDVSRLPSLGYVWIFWLHAACSCTACSSW